MEYTSPSVLLYVLTGFVVGLLAVNLWIDLRWSKEAQMMHAKRLKRK
ncbi:MAG: hypothetical protein AAFX93_02145 [Verrucomicrobiota bacterium]